MPDGKTLSEDEIWALVAYVKWLPYEETGKAAPKTVNNQALVR